MQEIPHGGILLGSQRSPDILLRGSGRRCFAVKARGKTSKIGRAISFPKAFSFSFSRAIGGDAAFVEEIPKDLPLIAQRRKSRGEDELGQSQSHSKRKADHSIGSVSLSVDLMVLLPASLPCLIYALW